MDNIANVIKLAHDIEAGRSGNHASKADWYRAITKASEAQRQPHESSEQSFKRFVTQDEDGKVMFKVYRGATGSDFAPPTPMTPVTLKADSPTAKIAKIADDLRAADPSLSRTAALAAARQNHPQLWAEAKLEAA